MSSTVVEKSVVEERLTELEEQIRKKAKVYANIQETLGAAAKDLREVVHEYQSTREKAQREVWAREGLGWCQRCDKFHPRRNIRFLYTVGRESYGSHGYESYGLYKRLRSFCRSCAEKMFSSPRGGESEFQCYKARRTKEGFWIFVSGSWQPLPDPERVCIDIERGYIPQSEYIFGKEIEFSGYPQELTIGDETITGRIY